MGQTRERDEGTNALSHSIRKTVRASALALSLPLLACASHAAEPHGSGTRELIAVLTGSLRMTVGPESYVLGPGDSLVFQADQPHTYENPAGNEGRYHNVIVYRR